MKYSLCDQHICSKWWLHGWVVSKYIIIILPSIHGNTFSLMSLFKNLTYTASDTSVLTLLQSTAFHIMAPRNLMPVLPKSDVTAGMWKWSADLVSWLWYSLFLWNKDQKKKYLNQLRPSLLKHTCVTKFVGPDWSRKTRHALTIFFRGLVNKE